MSGQPNKSNNETPSRPPLAAHGFDLTPVGFTRPKPRQPNRILNKQQQPRRGSSPQNAFIPSSRRNAASFSPSPPSSPHPTQQTDQPTRLSSGVMTEPRPPENSTPPRQSTLSLPGGWNAVNPDRSIPRPPSASPPSQATTPSATNTTAMVDAKTPSTAAPSSPVTDKAAPSSLNANKQTAPSSPVTDKAAPSSLNVNKQTAPSSLATDKAAPSSLNANKQTAPSSPVTDKAAPSSLNVNKQTAPSSPQAKTAPSSLNANKQTAPSSPVADKAAPSSLNVNKQTAPSSLNVNKQTAPSSPQAKTAPSSTAANKQTAPSSQRNSNVTSRPIAADNSTTMKPASPTIESPSPGMTPPGMPPPGITTPQESKATLPSNLSGLADRILVARSGISQGRVDITVSNTILPKTQISLRLEGGVLHVDISSQSPQSLSVLNTHLDGLRQALTGQTQQDVQIHINNDENEDESNQHSRQEYVAEDEGETNES